jgi:type II secretory pathway predicted ATPase ExeA
LERVARRGPVSPSSRRQAIAAAAVTHSHRWDTVKGRLHHFATLRLLSRDEIVQYIEHRCAIAGAPTVPFDEAAQQAIFEVARGNLRCTDELALKSLEHAARAGHKAVSPQHITLARRDLWQ